MVKEGFGHPVSEKVVDDKVRAAARLLGKLGAKVTEISVPQHLTAGAVFMPMVMEGMMRQAFFGNGIASGLRTLHVPGMVDRSKTWRERANEMPANVKAAMLFGTYMIDAFDGRIYAKGQNLKRKLTDEISAVLDEYDLLLMPTVPMTAPKLPAPGCSMAETVQRAWEMLPNTPIFDLTGHPSMSLPCGMSKDGLPVGMMLTGRHFDEPTIYKAAYAFEQKHDWTKL